MIYLSGKHDFFSNESFGRAEKKAKKIDELVLDPRKQLDDKVRKKKSSEQIMGIRLSLIDMCSSVFMIKGWELSPEANRELGYAMGQGKQVYFER